MKIHSKITPPLTILIKGVHGLGSRAERAELSFSSEEDRLSRLDSAYFSQLAVLCPRSPGIFRAA